MTNLFLEVSNMLEILLDGNEIDYTKAELCFLRKKIIVDFAKEGINQSNYDIYEHQNMLQGTIRYEIDNLYHTKLTDKIAESLKPYDYKGMPR